MSLPLKRGCDYCLEVSGRVRSSFYRDHVARSRPRRLTLLWRFDSSRRDILVSIQNPQLLTPPTKIAV